MIDQPSSRPPLVAPLLVRLAATWILIGALFKLFVGSPNDMPPLVREFFLGPTLTFRLAIAIELSIALPALLRPRLVWPLVAAQLAVFCAILVPLVASGAESCGCFGSKLTMPPIAMFAIDATLLAALLLTRPWRAHGAGRTLLVPIAAALALAWIAPFALIRTETGPPVSAGQEDGSAPRPLPRFVEWDPQRWVGRSLQESGLAAFLDVDLYPQDATWILYSPTCGDCAAFLRRLAGEFESEPKLYVLVRLPGDEGAQREVDLMPPGQEVELPGEVAYVVTPPWALEVAGGVVAAALHPEDV